MIAVAVIAGYVGIGLVSTVAQTFVAIAFVPAYPWVINRALRFSARMTSWRNVRFHWHGTYWGVAKVYLLWPIVALLSLGALAPMAARASREYLANHYGLGRERFAATTRLPPYYRALLWTMLLGAALLVLIAGPVAAVLSFTPSDEIGAGMSESLWLLVFAAGPVVVIVPTAICFQILTRNIIVSALSLGEVATFRSDLSPLRYL